MEFPNEEKDIFIQEKQRRLSKKFLKNENQSGIFLNLLRN